MTSTTRPALGSLGFSGDGEHWVEFGPPEARRRVGFHDYGAIYAVPGLYEAMFYERLGMKSTFEVVRLFGDALSRGGLEPGGQRVIDFGAGNGLGGQRLRDLGVGRVYGLDLEPAARAAASRDHPGVYDDYLVGDVGSWDDEELHRLVDLAPTAFLALSAIGIGHVPPATLERVIGRLPAGAVWGFAVHPRLLPESDDPEAIDSGFPDLMSRLLGSTVVLGRSEYVHRHHLDGSEDPAVAFVGRRAAAVPPAG